MEKIAGLFLDLNEASSEEGYCRGISSMRERKRKDEILWIAVKP